MSPSSALFVCGVITFLVVFSWFKVAAIEIFKLELSTNSIPTQDSWKKLFKVFFVDLAICIFGALVTGILFVIAFNSFH
ncbi:hypothetical protein OAE42_01310 [Gammaproteobacteria bacterium]|nr:hypothetical protein [Gammaproteobacteria bacterium]MDC1470453.1 hypothetical protein [Gammaproteobacteria bacterium]